MQDILAGLFRKINAHIVTTQSFIILKILKVTLLLSSVMAAKWRYRRNEEILIRDFDKDIALWINPSRTMGNSIYWIGFHEVKELVFLHRLLTPEMTFVDIGANQGEYSLFVAKRVPKGKVLSFEPLPSMQRMFERNVEANGFKNIQLYRYGLADKPGSFPIYEIADRHEGLATLYVGKKEVAKEYIVDLKVLDQECKDLKRLDFIKIDIEGGELPALRGCSALITRFRPWLIVEINEPTYKNAGYSVADVLNFFTELKYAPYRLDKNIQLVPCPMLPDFGNVIFKPQ